jgi:hypothetical protein
MESQVFVGSREAAELQVNCRHEWRLRQAALRWREGTSVKHEQEYTASSATRCWPDARMTGHNLLAVVTHLWAQRGESRSVEEGGASLERAY